MIEKLQQLHDNDPKAYWKLLEDLKSDDSVRAEPQISSDEWTDHFSSLNEIKHKFMTRADEISNLLEQKENVKEFNELDFKITPDELHAATVSLKNNKAVGFDSISNEMLKAGYGALRKSLLKLFNCILCNGDYPTEWKSAYITPVHKGGSPDDPNNYRGISILSCIAKLFNTILTRRLDNFLEQKNIISPL